ncbi:MAG: hypothetical protein ACOC6S_01765 [Chloroflexota bacterium]
MSEYEDKVQYAVSHTEVVRSPQQRLNTFGATDIHYYLLTEPMDSVNETRVREGRVIAERPKLVTPTYLLSIFEGFGEHDREEIQAILDSHGGDPNILEYKYRNEVKDTWTLSENISDVVLKMNSKIDEEGDSLAAIVKGPDDAWQIALMRFITDITKSSLQQNIADLSSRGLLDREQGIPKFVKEEIEGLFRAVAEDRASIGDLGSKLRSYGLFEQYQDRFFALLDRKR